MKNSKAFHLIENELRGLWRMGKRAWKLSDMQRCWRREEKYIRQADAQALEERQLSRLRWLIRHANDNIPFYRQKFSEQGVAPEDIRSLSDLELLPTLTKDDIRANFPDRMTAPGCCFPNHMIGKTSGSTSESLSFIRPDENFRRSLYYSVLLRTGGRATEQVFILSTPTCSPGCSLHYNNARPPRLATKLGAIRSLRHLRGMVGLPAYLENVLVAPDSYFSGLSDQLEAAQPVLLIADPVYLAAYARYLRRVGRYAPELTAIITTYELLTGSLRDLIKSTFACRIREQYGASEINDIANQCVAGQLHVRMDQVIVEVTRDGCGVAAGELGRVLVTDLWNTNMPFIRYDIGDVGSFAAGLCECGRNSQRLEAIHGRAKDLLHLGGQWITPLSIDRIFGDQPGLAAYQVAQVGASDVQISLQPEPGSVVDPKTFQAAAREFFGEDIRLTWRTVDEIRQLASQKFRFVYSNVDQPAF